MTMRIGIYSHSIENRGGGEKVLLVLAEHLARMHDVYLIVHQEVDLPTLARYFNVDLSRVTAWVIDPDRQSRSVVASAVDRYRLHGQIKRLGLDVFVNAAYHSSLHSPAPIGVYLCMFPKKLTRDSGNLVLDKIFERVNRRAIDSYQLILANSMFTQGWIRAYWGRDSNVVYPVVDDMSGPDIHKARLILNVGRFFAKGDAGALKSQETLVEVFGNMTEAHQAGWELHLAGSLARDAGSIHLAQRIRSIAEGLPITIHFDAEYEELRKLYRRASIYWHATGYGLDPKLHPEAQEHFGITTVEAMTAGAIPIVIRTAGQAETVEHGRNGFLWKSVAELRDFTYRVIRDESLRKTLRAEAVRSSARFGKNSFCRAFDKLLATVITIP